MLLTEFTTKCDICEIKLKLFSGMEEAAILDKGRILPLCKKCTKEVFNYIKTCQKKNKQLKK